MKGESSGATKQKSKNEKIASKSIKTSKDTKDIKNLDNNEVYDLTNDSTFSDHMSHQNDLPQNPDALMEGEGNKIDPQHDSFKYYTAKSASNTNSTEYFTEKWETSKDLKDALESLNKKLNFYCFHKYIQDLLLETDNNTLNQFIHEATDASNKDFTEVDLKDNFQLFAKNINAHIDSTNDNDDSDDSDKKSI